MNDYEKFASKVKEEYLKITEPRIDFFSFNDPDDDNVDIRIALGYSPKLIGLITVNVDSLQGDAAVIAQILKQQVNEKFAYAQELEHLHSRLLVKLAYRLTARWDSIFK